jgi:hypothetical protein
MDKEEIPKDSVSYSLTNEDIDNILGHKSNIKLYKELKKYDTIDKVLGKHKYVIILYETKQHYGHWTLVFKLDDNTIEHFDSYGLKPDDELDFIKPLFKVINGTTQPYLTYLLLKSKYNVEYNNYKLQEKKKGVNTCGRHILFRLINRDKNIDEYKKYLDKLVKKYKVNNYDELLTKIIIP